MRKGPTTESQGGFARRFRREMPRACETGRCGGPEAGTSKETQGVHGLGAQGRAWVGPRPTDQPRPRDLTSRGLGEVAGRVQGPWVSCPVLPDHFLPSQRNTQELSTYFQLGLIQSPQQMSSHHHPCLERLPGEKVRLEPEYGLQVHELQARWGV